MLLVNSGFLKSKKPGFSYCLFAFPIFILFATFIYWLNFYPKKSMITIFHLFRNHAFHTGIIS